VSTRFQHTHTKPPKNSLKKKIGIWEGKEETQNCSRSRRSRGKKTAREDPGDLRKEKKKQKPKVKITKFSDNNQTKK
jgi:hypothetical protein